MKKTIFITALLAALAWATVLCAFYGDYGTESVFTLGAGVRSVGMGGAYTAISDDSSGIAFNPAGQAWLERQEASFMYYPLYENTVFNSGVYGIPLLDFGTAAAAFYRISTGGIKGYDEFDVQIPDFEYSEYKVTMLYAKNINESLAFGVRVNAYGVNVQKLSGTGFGADAGIMYKPFDFLTVGATLENVVKPYISISGKAEDLPQRYILGLAGNYETAGFKFILSADFIAGERENFKYRAGAEIAWNNMLALRAGYDDGMLCLGGGLSLFNASVDYAFIANPYLGNLSVAGVSYSFGMSIDEQKKERAKEIREQVKKLVAEKISGDMSARADVLYEKAWFLWNNANYEESLAELQKALEWYPAHRNSKNLKSWIDLRLKELYYDSAVGFYNKADYLRAIENFKILQKYQEGFRDSRSYMAKIAGKIGVSGGASEGYFLSGVDFYVKKKYNEAVAQWKKVLDLMPGNTAIQQYIQSAGQSGETTTKARKKEASAEDKARSESIYYKAVDAYTSGDTEKAITLWEEAIRLNPDNIGAQRDLEKAKIETEELRRRGIK
jgi:tetratricopeptide (TPR) repeat protein